eukprot:3068698-Prymnesium_polylepis.1
MEQYEAEVARERVEAEESGEDGDEDDADEDDAHEAAAAPAAATSGTSRTVGVKRRLGGQLGLQIVFLCKLCDGTTTSK